MSNTDSTGTFTCVPMLMKLRSAGCGAGEVRIGEIPEDISPMYTGPVTLVNQQGVFHTLKDKLRTRIAALTCLFCSSDTVSYLDSAVNTT
mmetsp:Transcript_10820/g.16472  ORF Transcript_10820/g.16472 Transcript_10820/m.16472 type:complete len:90 (-) Transcript_10820:100-369(-)